MYRSLLALLACLFLALLPAAAAAQDESSNTAKSEERAKEHQTPEYQAELQRRSAENAASGAQIQASDPERQFVGDVCWHLGSGCAGDVRLYDFQQRGRGLVTPVLFTARNGSTISGHVWATKAGPARRPAIVITNGSIQASEQMYWWAAQTLAKAGYVVITSDPQGQGRSDNVGEGEDATEGVHSQVAGNTFYDGTQDALDFLLSSPAKPFCARPSRSGTSHCAKQERRVAEGRNAPFNPYHALVDPERVGIAGHSYGASGVSWVAQQDPRVDAVVAWDSLCDPSAADAEGNASCSRGGQDGPVKLRVPSLDLTVDYLMGRDSKRSAPDPEEKSEASRAFSKAGVDTGSIVIRGGTHFEFSYLPSTSFRATLRGIDLSAWYTLAWFDRYVKGDPTADRRLLSARWRRDPGDLAVDPKGGGNLLSYHYRSRLDVGHDGGRRFVCEDLRKGCAGQPADDGEAARWGFLPIATSRDGTPAYAAAEDGAAAPTRPAAAAGRTCTSRRSFRITARRIRGARVTRVVATVRGRRVGSASGRRVRVDLRGLPAGRAQIALRVTAKRAGRTMRVTQRRAFRLCAPRR